MSPFGLFSSEEKREETVQFKEFMDWFRDELEEKEDFIWSDVTARYSEIEDSVDQLEGALNEFMAEDLPEEIAPRLKNMAESNRKVLIGRVQSFVDKFEVPDEESYMKAEKFLQEKSAKLNEISEKIKKSLMVLDKAQPDVTNQVVDAMKEMERVVEVDEDLRKVTDIIEKHEELSEKRREISDLRTKKKEAEEELNEILREREDLRGELEELKESEETEIIEEKQQRIDGIENELKNQEGVIRSEVSPLKRGLKKLKYFGLSAGNEKLLGKYISSPVDAAKEDGDLTFLKKITEDLEEKLEAGELDFSQEEAERLEDELKSTNIKRVKDAVEAIRELRQEREELRSSLKNLQIDEMEDSLNDKIRRREDEIKDARERLDKEEDKIRSLQNTLQSLSEEIEELTEELLDVELKLEGVEP